MPTVILVRPADGEIRASRVALWDANPAHLEADPAWVRFGGAYIAGDPDRPDAIYAVAETNAVQAAIRAGRLVKVEPPTSVRQIADLLAKAQGTIQHDVSFTPTEPTAEPALDESHLGTLLGSDVPSGDLADALQHPAKIERPTGDPAVTEPDPVESQATGDSADTLTDAAVEETPSKPVKGKRK